MKEIIEEIKYRSDIADIISDYVKLKPAGTNYKGLCPFHNERFYYTNLMNEDNQAFNYLKKRGLDLKVIKNFGLGYAPDSWDSLKIYLSSKGYTDEELFESGLLSKSSKSDRLFDKFRNRIMFPIFDYKGNVIGFGGRVMDDGQPKYLNSLLKINQLELFS